MIFHDTVRVVFSANTGEYDAHGNPQTVTVDSVVPAQVWNLGSKDGPVDERLARYRMVLAPTVEIPPTGWSSLELHWRSFDGVTNSVLTVDGTVDHITARGRLHHYELTTQAVT